MDARGNPRAPQENIVASQTTINPYSRFCSASCSWSDFTRAGDPDPGAALGLGPYRRQHAGFLISGLDNNCCSQNGIVVLIALAVGVPILEFAKARREQGMSIAARRRRGVSRAAARDTAPAIVRRKPRGKLHAHIVPSRGRW
jgi:hypothetical protein